MRYRLLNVEIEHRKYPRTFSIPRKEQRLSLRVGQLAKLVFQSASSDAAGFSAERMWVIVNEIRAGGYAGVLDNDPQSVTEVRRGDIIPFGPEHVAAIYLQPEGMEIPYNKLAMVNQRVWDGEEWPGRLERRPPPDDEFSGWWIFSGRETDLEKAEGELFRPRAVADLIRRYLVLDSVLDEPAGTQWVWDEAELEYRRAGA